jgi:putative SOS response-associated peptidase YedK
MCGRFACSLSREAIKNGLHDNGINPEEWIDQEKYEGTYNVAPTYYIPVVKQSDNTFQLQSMVSPFNTPSRNIQHIFSHLLS